MAPLCNSDMKYRRVLHFPLPRLLQAHRILHSHEASPQLLAALRAYAHDLGLAFQIIDDLLDAEGNEEETGKPVGRDEKAGKATFVTILGAERARHQAMLLSEQAIQHLGVFSGRAKDLEDVARFVVDRKA